MNKPDWMPFYVHKYLASATVLRMSHVAGHAYMLILCQAWHQDPPGTVPDDDAVLAGWGRLTPRQWAKVREEVIRAFEKAPDGRWRQRFMAKVAEKSYSKMAQATAAGRASAAARKSTPVERPLNDRSNDRPTAPVVVLLPESNTQGAENTTTRPVERPLQRPLNDRCHDAAVGDGRLEVLTGVGLSFGVAQKLIREHNTPVELLRQYAEMSMGETVNNRAAFMRAAIAGGYAPKQVGSRFVADDDAAMREGLADGRARRAAKAAGAKP